MATKKKETTAKVETNLIAGEDVSTLNVYEKLMIARTAFMHSGLKQSGLNVYAEFTYFQLEDIVPRANDIFADLHCLFVTSFEKDTAYGRFINTDKPEETVEVQIDLSDVNIADIKPMTGVQAKGAEITYIRRYLYYLILDVIEQDELDSRDFAKPELPKAETKSTKPATAEQRTEIKQELTAVDSPADELQIKALKSALKTLKEKDPSKVEFIQTIALKTESFTKITREKCEALTLNIKQMIEQYGATEG